MLTLMSHLSVATIKGGTPMPLRNYKLEHDLIGLTLPSLTVQEAIFDQQLFLRFHIGSCSLFVQHLVQGCLKGLAWHPQVFSHLVEDWILLLLLFLVRDIGSGQPSGSSLYCLFLAIPLMIWSQSDSLLSMLFNGYDDIVKYSLDPWIWDLVQVLLNLLFGQAFVHPAQKVSDSVVLTFLVLQGEVVAS